MSAINISPWQNMRIQPQNNCRNGQIPTASYQSQLAQLMNQISKGRTKELFRWVGPVGVKGSAQQTPDSGGAGARTRWRFAAHTSPLCYRLAVFVVMAQQNGGASTSPFVSFSCANSIGTVLGSGSIYYGITPTAVTDSPSTFGTGLLLLDATAFPDTDIFCTFTDNNNARLVSATVYEVAQPADTTNGYINQQFSIGQAIYDTHRSDVEIAATKAWKRQGSQVLNWNTDTDASALSQSFTNVHVNIVDGSVSAPSASTAGYQLDMRYKNTIARTAGVPCVFAAYGKQVSTGVLNVEIVNSAGTVLQTLAGFGTSAGWITAALTLPATDAKYDLRYYNNSGALVLVTLYAVSIFEYLA